VKRALVVTLVLVVLFTGIPIVMGMPMVACSDCDLATIMANSCMLAVLTGLVAVALSLLAVRLATRPSMLAGLLLSSGLDRPPRLA
jgi:Mn2+/Fe2+ NRAMP family transporter